MAEQAAETTESEPQERQEATSPDAVTAAKAWAIAVDSLIVATARVVTRDKTLTPGNLPQGVRFGVGAGLVSLVVAIGGTLWLINLILTGFSGDVSATLGSSAFQLTVLNNSPFDVALVGLSLSAVVLLAACLGRRLRWSALGFLTIPLASLVLARMTQAYAGSLIGTPIVLEVQEKLKSDNDAQFEKGARLVTAILDVPGITDETRNDLQLALLSAYKKQGKELDAFHLAADLVRRQSSSEATTVAANTFADLMFGIGQGMESRLCIRLYENLLAPLPQEIRPSPFRFAVSESWDWMERNWDPRGRRYGSQKNNVLLHGLASHYEDHPDIPYILYLLGEAETLEESFAAEAAGLLAAFTLARPDYFNGLYSDAMRERLQRIIASDSSQTFVDDAALYYAKVLTADNQPAEAMRVLEMGLGRGDKDRKTDIVNYMHQTAALLDEEQLDTLVFEPIDATVATQLRSNVRSSLAALAAWHRIVNDPWDAAFQRRMARYSNVLKPSILGHSGTLDPTRTESLSRASSCVQELATMLLTEAATLPSNVIASAKEALLQAAVLQEHLKKLDLGNDQITRQHVVLERRLARHYWERFLAARGWLGEDGLEIEHSPEVASMSGFEVQLLEQQINDFEATVGKKNFAVARGEVAQLRTRLSALLQRGVSRDVLVSRRLDELREQLGSEWIESREEIAALISELDSLPLRQRHWAYVSNRYLRLARDTPTQPSLQALYLERALEAHLASMAEPPDLTDPARLSVVANIQSGMFGHEADSVRGILSEAINAWFQRQDDLLAKEPKVVPANPPRATPVAPPPAEPAEASGNRERR